MKKQGLAITAFLLGIVPIIAQLIGLLLFIFGFDYHSRWLLLFGLLLIFLSTFFGVISLVVNIVALWVIRQSPGEYGGKGKAIAGTALSAFLIVEALLLGMAVFFVGRMGQTMSL